MPDINALRLISSDAIREANEAYKKMPGSIRTSEEDQNQPFSSVFTKAVDNINRTNAYLSDAENEEIRWALGETDSTHDLSVALQKASTALQYTVAVRDRAMSAYQMIMNMQI